MASSLKMSKEEALGIANQIKQISADNAKAVSTMTSLNNRLKTGWTADAQVAYDECFTSMKDALSKYTELIQDYSETLTKVCNGMFQNDSEYASQIRAKYGK